MTQNESTGLVILWTQRYCCHNKCSCVECFNYYLTVNVNVYVILCYYYIIIIITIIIIMSDNTALRGPWPLVGFTI
jgi:hypothetical protein